MLYESQARYSEAESLLKQALHRTRLYFINQTSKPEYRDPEMWSPYVMVGG